MMGGVSCLWWGSMEGTRIHSESIKGGPLLIKRRGHRTIRLLEIKKDLRVLISINRNSSSYSYCLLIADLKTASLLTVNC